MVICIKCDDLNALFLLLDVPGHAGSGWCSAAAAALSIIIVIIIIISLPNSLPRPLPSRCLSVCLWFHSGKCICRCNDYEGLPDIRTPPDRTILFCFPRICRRSAYLCNNFYLLRVTSELDVLLFVFGKQIFLTSLQLTFFWFLFLINSNCGIVWVLSIFVMQSDQLSGDLHHK